MIDVLFLAIAAQTAPVAYDVAFEELARDANRAAIERIQNNERVPQEHAARLINLGVAYAREGDHERARTLFEQAADARRMDLETATGEWKDSRHLALAALAKLNRGEFDQAQLARR